MLKRGFVKTPSPFKWFFQTLSFFPLIVFPSAGFTPWSKNSHEREQGKGKGIVKEGKRKNRKGRGKGKEKERERKGKGKRKRKEKERKTKGKGTEKETEKERKKERKKDRKKERRKKRKSKGRDRKKERERKGRGNGKKKAVSHTDHFWCQKLSFCYRSWILCVCSFFSGNHQKRSVATTYQAPSLCRNCATTTTNNERKRPKALNSRRMMEKSRTLDFKSLDTDH